MPKEKMGINELKETVGKLDYWKRRK